MTITEIKNLIDDLIDTSEAKFPTARKVRLINKAQDKVVNQLIEKDFLFQYDDPNYTDLNEGYLNIVSGQKDYNIREDENFAGLLFISEIHILPSATATLYDDCRLNKTGKYLSVSDTGVPTQYRISGSSIIFEPVPNYNATNGIKINFIRKPLPVETSDTTKSLGIPVTYHYLVALHTAYDYARAKVLSNRNDILNEIVNEEKRLGIYANKLNNDANGIITTEYVNSV